MAGTFRQVAKATFLVSKKDGLSDEEFRKHYTEVHAPMALDLCKRYGVLDYSIHFNTEVERAATRAAFGDKASLINCDAITTFVFPDMKSLLASFADPEYETKLGPDERNFANGQKLQFAVSDEFVVLAGGQQQKN
ncbi:EthD domain-containing protein [Trichoderma austrokoningii]